jgi:hypothetical protein
MGQNNGPSAPPSPLTPPLPWGPWGEGGFQKKINNILTSLILSSYSPSPLGGLGGEGVVWQKIAFELFFVPNIEHGSSITQTAWLFNPPFAMN